MRPQVFHRVELRSVRRQRFEFQPGMIGLHGANVGSAMAVPAVPDDDGAAANVPQQLPQECGDASSVNEPLTMVRK